VAEWCPIDPSAPALPGASNVNCNRGLESSRIDGSRHYLIWLLDLAALARLGPGTCYRERAYRQTAPVLTD
jgi:hypothetical protein